MRVTPAQAGGQIKGAWFPAPDCAGAGAARGWRTDIMLCSSKLFFILFLWQDT